MPDKKIDKKIDKKTLVFSFDGTANEPSDAKEFEEDESISNVLKLHVLMGGGIGEDMTDTKTPEGKQQKTYYYSGIGTRENGIFRSLVNKVLAPVWGDAGEILAEAKRDFDKAKYSEGDTLVVFGFSRGAVLARLFANELAKKPKPCEVSFLGVFDTVVGTMLGISESAFNKTLNERINRAVHIVSLDEDRERYTPTLINKDAKRADRILEVWFPGGHSDIGGGYWFDGLSDVTLQFMIDECKKAIKKRILIHEDNASIRTLFQKQGKALSPPLDVDDIAIHPLLHGMMHEEPLRVGGRREPRKVYVCDKGECSRHEDDIPILHHSVMRRFAEVPSYRPPALRGKRFRLLRENGRKSKVIQGISGLRTLKWS